MSSQHTVEASQIVEDCKDALYAAKICSYAQGMCLIQAASDQVKIGEKWSGVEWSGVEWSGVEWNAVERSGVEWGEKKRKEKTREDKTRGEERRAEQSRAEERQNIKENGN
jgi:6-phosphogluconate dehydrogenase, C-terminal domain